MACFMTCFMTCFMARCIIFPSILAPKNGEKILILAKFWTPQTKILASLDKVCSTRAKLFYVACKINRASQYRIDRYGPMLLTQADNGYPLRQSSRIPNFQPIFEQHNLNRSSACVISMHDSVDNCFGNRLNRQFITDIYLGGLGPFSNTSINTT